MEEKYCERCGVFLGKVLKTKRYCKECAILVKKENQAARRAPYGVVPCEWCKRPMRKVYEHQKYHQKCANAVKRKRVADWWKEHPDYIKTSSRKARPKGNQMGEKPKPKYTIKQMNDKAKELGMSYGHYSTLLAQGKVDPPDER